MQFGNLKSVMDQRFSTKEKTMEEREHVPDIPCGKCKNFYQKIGGPGHCTILYIGSDIAKDPPVYITEGPAHLTIAFNKDASKCKYYEKMKIIDTDISESPDPMYSRHQRQMQDK
ncbi:MAG: hypothetical protein GY864_15395 [Desulfobacterales bacterium]|nr:hypothetical protein [Desulfobacterales bacterium]